MGPQKSAGIETNIELSKVFGAFTERSPGKSNVPMAFAYKGRLQARLANG